MENDFKDKQNSLNNKNEDSNKEKLEKKKIQKIQKKEITFEKFLNDKKAKIIDLKSFFENKKNNFPNNLKVSNLFFYDTKEDLLEILKKLLSIYLSNKTVKIPYPYNKLIYEFTINEIIKINEKDRNISTLNIEELKKNFLPNVSNFETVIKLVGFFSTRKIDKDTPDTTIFKDNLIFLEIIKLYLNQLVVNVNWLSLDKIVKLVEAIENLKPCRLNERKVISNSLFFINKLDYIFSLNELFRSFKNKIKELYSIQKSYENTINDLKRAISNMAEQISEVHQEKTELEDEINALKNNLKMMDVSSQSSEAGSAQKQNEIIGRMQTKLSSFLSYELNIANEAILDGDEGTKLASKMIEELTFKIKEEKKWLSALD